jgi:hypothetical protein
MIVMMIRVVLASGMTVGITQLMHPDEVMGEAQKDTRAMPQSPSSRWKAGII